MKQIKLWIGFLMVASVALIADDACPQTPFYTWCVKSTPACEPVDYTNSNGDVYGKTFFSVRPQDSNSVRRLISWPTARVWEDNHNNFANFTVEFQRSFNAKKLGTWFFFNGGDCMTVGVPNRTAFTDVNGTTFEPIAFDVDGSQLGLSAGNAIVPNPDLLGGTLQTLKPGLIGAISACPTVTNVIFDLDFHVDLSCICEGLWFEADLPIVYTRNSMNFSASGVGQTIEPFPAGLFGTQGQIDNEFACSPVPVAYSSIVSAFNGPVSFGSVSALHSGKFPLGSLSATHLAAVHLDFGYDFVAETESHIAASLHIAAPTGNRPHGDFVFEPIVGANKSWQAGITFQGDHTWQQPCSWGNWGDMSLSWYLIATHLFKSRQTRVFSFTPNGPGSQYLLLKQISPTAQVNTLEHAANVFAGETRIGASIMFDGSVMMDWNYRCDNGYNLNFGLGYNLWARSAEKRAAQVCFRNYNIANGLVFGIKGAQNASSFDYATTPPTCEFDDSTASGSTISLPGAPELDELPGGASGPGPVFVGIENINFSSALHPGTFSNKIFASIKGTTSCFFDREAFLLVGGSVEIGNKNKSLNYGAVFVQGGMTF